MKQITINQFKELTSGMTADEMIDMIPIRLTVWGKQYYMDTYGPSGRLPQEVYHLMYYCYEMKQVLVSLYSDTTKGINEKMLLRLLTNNYLSDYQLITDGKITSTTNIT